MGRNLFAEGLSQENNPESPASGRNLFAEPRRSGLTPRVEKAVESGLAIQQQAMEDNPLMVTDSDFDEDIDAFLGVPEPEPEADYTEIGSTIAEQTPNLFMQTVGGAMASVGNAPGDMVGDLVESEAGADDSLLDKVMRNASMASNLVMSGGPAMLLSKLTDPNLREHDRKLAETGQAIHDEAVTQNEEALKNLNLQEESFKWYLTTGGQAFIKMVPTIAAGMAGGTPAALSMMGNQVFADSYGSNVRAGLDAKNARAKALYDVFAELAFENKVFDVALSVGAKPLEKIVKSALGEGAQEVLTETLQMAYDVGVLNEEMTTGEAFKRLRQAFVLGAGVGAGMATTVEGVRAVTGDKGADDPADIDPDQTAATDVDVNQATATDGDPVTELYQREAEQNPTYHGGVDFEKQNVTTEPTTSLGAGAAVEKDDNAIDFDSGNVDSKAAVVENEIARHSRGSRLPENLPDPRLARDDYRKKVEDLSSVAVPSAGKGVNVDTDDLLSLIAKLGGIDVEQAKAEGIDPEDMKNLPGFKRPFNKRGDSVDGMRENLTQYGFNLESSNDLLDMVQRAIAGESVYSPMANLDHQANNALLRELGEDLPPNQVQEILKKALQPGAKLGVREARIVSAALDSHQDERTKKVDPAREALEAARKDRRAMREGFAPASVYETDMDGIAGEQYEEDAYNPDWDAETRSMRELADEAAAIDPDATESALDSVEPDPVVARKLVEIINNGRQEQSGPAADEAGSEKEIQAETEQTGGGSKEEAQGQELGDLEKDISPASDFIPTHETSDGEPVVATDEPNVYLDAEGVEIEDTGATKIEKGIEASAHEAATSPKNDLPEPTEAQKEAGNYKVGKVNLHGMDISIENPKGSVRKGVNKNGDAWENELHSHYGYIRRTEGADGDHVDIFLTDNAENAGNVFVVDQIDPDTGKFDEHKIMLGPVSQEEARAEYLKNYDKGWKGAAAITEMDIADFKTWLKEGDTTKPLTDIKKALVANEEKPDSARPEKQVKAEKTSGKTVKSGHTYRGQSVIARTDKPFIVDDADIKLSDLVRQAEDQSGQGNRGRDIRLMRSVTSSARAHLTRPDLVDYLKKLGFDSVKVGDSVGSMYPVEHVDNQIEYEANDLSEKQDFGDTVFEEKTTDDKTGKRMTVKIPLQKLWDKNAKRKTVAEKLVDCVRG